MRALRAVVDHASLCGGGKILFITNNYVDRSTVRHIRIDGYRSYLTCGLNIYTIAIYVLYIYVYTNGSVKVN